MYLRFIILTLAMTSMSSAGSVKPILIIKRDFKSDWINNMDQSLIDIQDSPCYQYGHSYHMEQHFPGQFSGNVC